MRDCSTLRFCSEVIDAPPTTYVVDNTKATYDQWQYTAPIKLGDQDTPYTFTITHLFAGFRFRLNHPENQTFRFDVSKEDMIFTEEIVDKTTINVDTESDPKVHRIWLNQGVNSDLHEAIVQFNPFKITYRVNNVTTMIFNRLNRLYVENGDPIEPAVWDNFTETFPHGKTGLGGDFSFPSTKSNPVLLSGLAEHFNDLNIPDTPAGNPLRRYNYDGYSNYGTIPMLYTHSPHSPATTGLFYMNPTDTYIEIGSVSKYRNVRFISEGGHLDYIVFFSANSPLDIVLCYTALTGRPSLPPIWAFGYHQSRWGYMNQSQVETVMTKLDEGNFSYDALWLDVDHLKGYAPFQFNRDTFPDPEGLAKRFEDEDRILVRLCDCHLPTSSALNSTQYNEAHEKQFFVRTADDAELNADCWPGDSAWPDFSRPAVREWYSTQFLKENSDVYSEHIFYWNDMNEPATFNMMEGTIAKDALQGDETIGIFEHRELHSLYGLANTAATYKGLLDRSAQKERPFILTRSFWAGSQRTAWVWSGDNTADWENLRVSLAIVQNMGLCGFPYTGSDMGGFYNTATDPELLTRWFQLASLTAPFFREHAINSSDYREPYLFPEEVQRRLRRAVQLRYRLLPLIYSTVPSTTQIGEPPVLPLFAAFPGQGLDAVAEEALLARSILACPALYQGQTALNVTKPPGRWFRFPDDGAELPGEAGESAELAVTLDDSVAFARGGRVIPLFEAAGRNVRETLKGSLELVVALDGEQKAAGSLYLDDGHSLEVTEKLEVDFEFSPQRFFSTVTSVDPEYSLLNITKISIYGMDGTQIQWNLADAGTPQFDADKNVTIITGAAIPVSIAFDFNSETPTTASEETSSKSISTTKPGSHGKLTTGQAVGIAVGVIAAVGIAIGVVVWIKKRSTDDRTKMPLLSQT